MDRVGSYGVDQNSFYSKTRSTNATKTSKTSEKSAAKKTDKNSQVNLSENAKKLLKELQKTYKNMDFIIADYESDEEAASYLSRGTNQYSVLLSPDELEKMAADKDVKKQNLQMLDNAVNKLSEMRSQLGEKGKDISRLGVAIDNNGQVSYFAELEKVSEKQRERIEERRESKREEAREAEKKAKKEQFPGDFWGKGQIPGRDSVKRTTVHASSVEELVEKIGAVNWDDIQDEFIPEGHRFNFTV